MYIQSHENQEKHLSAGYRNRVKERESGKIAPNVNSQGFISRRVCLRESRNVIDTASALPYRTLYRV